MLQNRRAVHGVSAEYLLVALVQLIIPIQIPLALVLMSMLLIQVSVQVINNLEEGPFLELILWRISTKMITVMELMLLGLLGDPITVKVNLIVVM